MKLAFILIIIAIALLFMWWSIYTAPLYDEDTRRWIKGRKNIDKFMKDKNKKNENN